MTENPKHRSAADLLADWRAADRDAVAARDAAKVASLALAASASAEEAAAEVEVAVEAALEAVERARAAAGRAREAATQAAEAATIALSTAEGDKVRADIQVRATEEAETAAKDRFHEAQAEGFPKD